jgi:putative tryptophan/tyrosine transport system substrate-binding protein
MRRREFITLLGSAAAWPLSARAQQSDQMRRIGVLLPGSADDPEIQARVAAFLQKLQQLGWIDGRNAKIDYRLGASDAERMRRHVGELVALAPDVILANGTSAVGPLLDATRSVPIVFVQVSDPVGAGYVASLARPGGNATGFALFEYGMSGKWLELLKEVAPGVTRAAVLRDATAPTGIAQLAALHSVAPSLGVVVSPLNVRDPEDIERSIPEFARAANGGLILTAGTLGIRHRDLIVRLAARHVCRRSIPTASSPLGRPDVLRDRFKRHVPARGCLHRSYPQGREGGRPAGSGADKVRTGDQSEDRQSARGRLAAHATCPRRRGY